MLQEVKSPEAPEASSAMYKPQVPLGFPVKLVRVVVEPAGKLSGPPALLSVGS